MKELNEGGKATGMMESVEWFLYRDWSCMQELFSLEIRND